MVGALVLSLTICAAATTTDIGRAPELPPWTPGLPSPLEAPVDGEWIGRDGTAGGRGTWLPDGRDAAVLERLLILDAYTGRCQARIDAVADVMRADCYHARLATDVAAAGRWPAWQVALVAAGALVVGGVLGVAVGAVL